MANKNILDDIVDDCKKEYCTLKEILVHSGISDRVLMQLKCIEKYKFQLSKKYKKDYGWENTFNEWVNNGYAVKFSELYSENVYVQPLYKKIMNGDI